MIKKFLVSPVTRIRFLALIVAVAVWEAAAVVGPIHEFLPHVWEVGRAIGSIMTDEDLGTHLRATMTALVVGVAVGATSGILVGLALASSKLMRMVFEPIVIYLAAIPKIIVYPIFVWFFSIGVASKIGLSVLSSFFPVVVTTMSAGWVIRPTWPKAATMLGASKLQRLVHVSLPAMAPTIATGVRLGVSVGIVATLAAETKVGKEGVGFLIIDHYARFRLPEMYATVFVVFVAASLVGIGLERLTRNIAGAEQRRARQTSAL